ncbi:antitoxin [Actinomadura flavalba]|uniref:antitoxin n=1 Tax=Actinomadura flavalba TaxID=1120938 RepID=UPI0003647C62|nr:antitoxin [Actinomadura flavalba]
MSFIDKIKDMLGQHSDKAKQGVEKGGDMIDKRTGGKYADRVDQAQAKANEYLDRDRRGGGDGAARPEREQRPEDGSAR